MLPGDRLESAVGPSLHKQEEETAIFAPSFSTSLVALKISLSFDALEGRA